MLDERKPQASPIPMSGNGGSAWRYPRLIHNLKLHLLLILEATLYSLHIASCALLSKEHHDEQM